MKSLYKNWHVHNIIAHPLMGILVLIGVVFRTKSLESTANWIHNVTLPKH